MQLLHESLFLTEEVKTNWTTASRSQNLLPEDTYSNFHVFVENLSQEIVTKDIKSSHSPTEGMPDTWVIRDTATGKVHRAPTLVLSFCMLYN